VLSVPAAGAPIATPSTTPQPGFVRTTMLNASWSPAARAAYPLVFSTTSSSCGREGCNFGFNATLLVCSAGAVPGTCRAAALPQLVSKGGTSAVITNGGTALPPRLSVAVPPVSGTIEVVTRWWSYAGLVVLTTGAWPSAGAAACSCPPSGRTYVSLAALTASAANEPARGAGSSGGGGGGGGGAWSASPALVGGLSAAGAVVGAALAVAATVYFRRAAAASDAAAAAAAAAAATTPGGGAAPAAAAAGEPGAASAAGSVAASSVAGTPSPASTITRRSQQRPKAMTTATPSTGTDEDAGAAAAPRRTPLHKSAAGAARATTPAAGELRV
jgi:hypothetical protein